MKRTATNGGNSDSDVCVWVCVSPRVLECVGVSARLWKRVNVTGKLRLRANSEIRLLEVVIVCCGTNVGCH